MWPTSSCNSVNPVPISVVTAWPNVGGGLVGPNLTDDYWIHGPNFADNVHTIWNGVEAKGMLAWKKQGMKPAQVIEVASYIYTLRGAELLTPGKMREDLAPVDTGPSEFE